MKRFVALILVGACFLMCSGGDNRARDTMTVGGGQTPPPAKFDGFVFTGFYQLNFSDYDRPHPGVAVGKTISGPGVPGGTVVTFVGPYYVTMSQKATLATSGTYFFTQ